VRDIRDGNLALLLVARGVRTGHRQEATGTDPGATAAASSSEEERSMAGKGKKPAAKKAAPKKAAKR
jgi:hypothetical protein